MLLRLPPQWRTWRSTSSAIKNVTKPVTFPVTVVGVILEGKGWRVGYNGELTIDRRDWGIVDNRLTPADVLP